VNGYRGGKEDFPKGFWLGVDVRVFWCEGGGGGVRRIVRSNPMRCDDTVSRWLSTINERATGNDCDCDCDCNCGEEQIEERMKICNKCVGLFS
jgi:hypothetical protein